MAQSRPDRRDRSQSPQAPGGPAAPPARADPQAVRQIFAAEGYLAVNRLGEQWGTQLAVGKVGRSPVRDILESFQGISESWEATGASERRRQIALLKPRLVYRAARETDRTRRRLLEQLAAALGVGIDEVLESGIDELAAKSRFTALVDLTEAITAYHRAASN